MSPISQRIAHIEELVAPFARWETDSVWSRLPDRSAVCDFVYGNPHDTPVAGFHEALGRWSVPRTSDWFAYKTNEPAARAIVSASLRASFGLPFEDEDIFMTNGAFAALSVVLATITDPGDEVLFISPPWFFYEPLIATSGAIPVRVKVDPLTFDLDLAAIQAAIGPRTRAIIVNSPNNPTGVIYQPATLERLALLLDAASARLGRTIYLISDEAYRRILFDGADFQTPTAYYANSFMLYTYGKTLLTPGQRIGYIALPPAMPERESIRSALFIAQLMAGFAFPNALLQHALGDLDQLSIDIPRLQRKRDRLVSALRAMGYDLAVPAATFYLLVRSPLADDWAFAELLATHGIFCLPGLAVEMPGWFRISLTANEEMIEQSLPGFAAAIRQAGGS